MSGTTVDTVASSPTKIPRFAGIWPRVNLEMVADYDADAQVSKDNPRRVFRIHIDVLIEGDTPEAKDKNWNDVRDALAAQNMALAFQKLQDSGSLKRDPGNPGHQRAFALVKAALGIA